MAYTARGDEIAAVARLIVPDHIDIFKVDEGQYVLFIPEIDEQIPVTVDLMQQVFPPREWALYLRRTFEDAVKELERL